MQMSFDYDLFVIGGGSGGVRAARVAAADTGAKVGMAEESRYGGTCVIRGCVPKKLMVFASTYAPAMKQAAAYGWDVEAGGFDWTAFRMKLEGELDRLLNGLGVDTHLWYRGSQVLRGFDEEAREVISQGMKERGVTIVTETNIVQIDKVADGVQVKDTQGAVHDFNLVMYATGRAPNSAGLDLEALGVGLNGAGAIEVDSYSQTAVPSIYAVGDVTNRVNLTPVAIREGMAFVETAMKGNPTPVDHALIPSAVFTQPEYGTIGLSEEKARAQEAIEVYATTFRPMNTSFINDTHEVLMKLVVSQASRKVLGCHIVADGAGEMIQMVGIAVKMGATKEDFDRVCAVHPTMSEELVTMKSPVRTA
jgi:glutathione reductase (NADPH)